jgi:hypothetical protein
VNYDNSAVGGVASTPPTRPFFQNKKKRFRMETKEIAMSKHTTILGTACVLGMALTAVPAAAATLTGFSGVVVTSYGQNNPEEGDNIKNWLLGGSIAGPLSDLPNLNFQFDASYDHNWADDFSAEVWNLGGNAFWANNDGRIGINVNYETITHLGHRTNFGAFGEWYFGNITGMAKGGWVSAGGSPVGGHGNYLGAAISGYFIPDLAITGGVEWAQDISGFGCQTCGRIGSHATALEIAAEFLFSEDFGVSGFASYSHTTESLQGDSFDDNAFRIGLRWYTGGGSLMDRHRNGNLNPWLPGIGAPGFVSPAAAGAFNGS